MRGAAIAIAVASILSLSRTAAAQSAQTTAEVLFDEGRRLMGEKRFAEACPKLAESRRLDPGIGVALYLGECYAQNGQFASAWGAFREAGNLARNAKDTRAKVADDRAADMEKRLYRVALVVPPQARISGLSVQRDGAALGEALWGVEFPLDPGDHTFSASAPGKATWTKSITVPKDPGRTSVDLPVLEDEKPIAATPPPPKPVAPPTQPPPAEPPSDGSGRRMLGLGIGVAGVIGVGVGAVFGLTAISKKKDVEGHCSGSVCDSTAAVDKRESARNSATISTVGFVVGGVLLAGGAVIFFTAPKAESKTGIRIVPGIGSLGIDGRF